MFPISSQQSVIAQALNFATTNVRALLFTFSVEYAFLEASILSNKEVNNSCLSKPQTAVER